MLQGSVDRAQDASLALSPQVQAQTVVRISVPEMEFSVRLCRTARLPTRKLMKAPLGSRRETK